MARHTIKNKTSQLLRYTVTMIAGNQDCTGNESGTETVDVAANETKYVDFEGAVVKSVTVSEGKPPPP